MKSTLRSKMDRFMIKVTKQELLYNKQKEKGLTIGSPSPLGFHLAKQNDKKTQTRTHFLHFSTHFYTLSHISIYFINPNKSPLSSY